jgi:hypothetical protein
VFFSFLGEGMYFILNHSRFKPKLTFDFNSGEELQSRYGTSALRTASRISSTTEDAVSDVNFISKYKRTEQKGRALRGRSPFEANHSAELDKAAPVQRAHKVALTKVRRQRAALRCAAIPNRTNSTVTDGPELHTPPKNVLFELGSSSAIVTRAL